MIPEFINPNTSPTLIFIVQIIIGILGFFWIIALLRTARDANARYLHQGGFFFSIFLITILTPLIGLPLYYAIRPIKYKWDHDKDKNRVCPSCNTTNQIQANYCTSCGYRLKKSCYRCQANNVLHSRYCYACGAHFPSSS